MPNPPEHSYGHFYSPVVDTDDVAARREQIWPPAPRIVGIDFRDASHRRILCREFPRYLPDFDYPEQPPGGAEDHRYYTLNSQFGWLDARALFVLMRAWRPARIIEVGSGYSSQLMADINRRFLGGRCEITCIEPFPRPFLREGVPGIDRLVEARVQDVPLETFAALRAGDVLFIDSSHVAKTGSDVNWLYFEVLPRLRPGVRVHIHDIFLPHDYPPDWVIDLNRSWNEQYLLRALLLESNGFEVVFGCNYAYSLFPELVRAALAHPDGRAYGGGSFWIRRKRRFAWLPWRR